MLVLRSILHVLTARCTACCATSGTTMLIDILVELTLIAARVIPPHPPWLRNLFLALTVTALVLAVVARVVHCAFELWIFVRPLHREDRVLPRRAEVVDGAVRTAFLVVVIAAVMVA